MNLTTGASPERILSLENIRGQLIRLEDTIIFCEWEGRTAVRRGLEFGSEVEGLGRRRREQGFRIGGRRRQRPETGRGKRGWPSTRTIRSL
jgi:hypothetical protein